MTHQWTIDWSTQLVITTGASDQSITIPANSGQAKSIANPQPAATLGSWWLMGVAGQPAYINQGAAATSANVLHPVGRDDVPKRLPPGTVMHALQGPGGAGQVWFVRCYPVE